MNDYDISPLTEQAASLYEAGRLVEALACYARACAMNGDDAQAWSMRGNISQRLDDLRGAEECHRQAVRCMPGAPELHFSLGTVLQAQGRNGDAIGCFRETLRLNPQHMASAFSLSRVLAITGQAREALKYSLVTLGRGVRQPELVQHFVRVLGMQRDVRALKEARSAIEQCFEATDLDLQQLSRPVTEILKREAAFTEMMSLARAEGSQELQAGLLAGRFAGLLHDKLFMRALTWTLICDSDFELLLGCLRRIFLHIVGSREIVAGRAGIVDDDVELLAAIACQCYSSEYCYTVGLEEAPRLDLLEGELLVGRSNGMHDMARLCVYGMYRPLHRLPGVARLIADNDGQGGKALGNFLRIQWYGPQQELGNRSRIVAVTRIDDSTSRSVRAMYEESPYPPWQTVARHVPRPFRQFTGQMFPASVPPEIKDGKVNMLVAGCGTGKQAIMSASRFTDSSVLAVDLSLSSLAYAQRKADELGIENIEFAHADILRMATLPDRYHVIESVGVLHHMENLQQGLDVLAGLLHKNGLMNIGLYSEIARRDIAGLQARLREMGLDATPGDIRQARQTILTSDTEACRRIARLADFYSISGCRDLLFHVQEHCYRLPEISSMLERAGLRFLGFGWTDRRVPNHYLQMNPDDTLMTDLEKWDAFEQQYPDTFLGMYVFWCQKI